MTAVRTPPRTVSVQATARRLDVRTRGGIDTLGPPDIGMRAPSFALKDRTGVIYGLDDLSGPRTVLLFLWDLDTSTKLWIRELNRRTKVAPGSPKSAVIMLQPNRVAIREFMTSEPGMSIPILFATPAIARLYGLSPATSALFVLEHGTVMRRHLGDVVVSSVVPLPTVFR